MRRFHVSSQVLCSGALDEAIAMMEAEIDAGVEALGPWANDPNAAQLILWARVFARGMALKSAA